MLNDCQVEQRTRRSRATRKAFLSILDDQGRRLEDFTRIETFGDNQANGNNDVHWLKVLVSPRTREVFAYQPQIVTANRAAVPAP